MSDLQGGTLTLLFSDIEGSTTLLREQRDAFPAMLDLHHEIFRTAFANHGGTRRP